MAELFRDAGYATAAVVTNWVLIPATGASRGFDSFHHCSYEEPRPVLWPPDSIARLLGTVGTESDRRKQKDENERASVVTPAAEAMLRQLSARPFLFWVHYMDPHAPYDPPSIPEQQRPQTPTCEALAGYVATVGTERTRWLRAYAAEIEFFDGWLGGLIRTIKEAELWDSSIVVFWSDHGDEFWEHGGVFHGTTIYQELLHVPLIIHMPEQTAGAHVGEPVSLIDVMPTLLEKCAIGAPADLPGGFLRPILSGHGSLDDFRVFLEGTGLGSIRKGLIAADIKLIYDVYADSFSLYDMRSDPGEQRNIHGTPLAPDTSEMERDLLAWAEESLAMMDEYVARGGAEDIPPEIRQRLRDMGYIQ